MTPGAGGASRPRGCTCAWISRLRGAARAETGQLLPFVLLVLMGLLLLFMGLTGYAAAGIARLRLQAAADAAALAATRQAEPWLALSVHRHLYDCVPLPAGGVRCADFGASVWNLPPTYEPALIRRAADGLPGWAGAAGCARLSDAGAGAPDVPVVVCDGWRLQSDTFGIGYGFGYPAGSDPEGAARAMLRSNAAGLMAHGVPVGILAFATDDATGAATLTVRASEPGNPLRVVTQRPVVVTVQAGARPRLAGPVPARS